MQRQSRRERGDSSSRIVRLVAPVREHVVDIIRQQILSGDRAPGERLVERELTEEFDISRNTLREAYRQLEAEGFIVLTPHKGPIVYRLSAAEAKAIYELREAIECFAVQLFAERASDEQVEELAECVAEVSAAHRVGEITAILSVKDRFYETLYAGSGNPLLRQHINLLQARLVRLRAASLSTPGRLENSAAEIERVMDKIAHRDANAARDLWRVHIGNAAAAALTQFES